VYTALRVQLRVLTPVEYRSHFGLILFNRQLARSAEKLTPGLKIFHSKTEIFSAKLGWHSACIEPVIINYNYFKGEKGHDFS